ncbi:LacI family DNA-binding transcriptional regulator [Kribbella sandramycini]|uniref:DNA-binding LacI/PurR family transcriptional regulator n=1 Tax=Kribbella sandramycini TaxID=60450 RepID=A0A7Y4KVZ0_9ACTN|nr:LacI family DNA-binding transcriptional regulator [Kribbella sandramycini]MBB6567825.1 DNA-binding LacI/PurR family transcriptional regulator [Kribbella sandramycini]NOL39580.1 LacI family DNA-binding transcriptional regulator [Kribbella sandramycini]
MADVAALAGVSGQTVSRVANNRTNVDATTRARVRAAMRELGYRPNGAARALRSGAFHGIGVIVFELSTFGTTRTLDAIATAATERGYAVNLMPVLDINQRAVTAAFNRLSAQAVDGVIILIEAYLLDEAGVQLPHGLPVVVVDSSAHYDYPVVDTDQFQGAGQATGHLLDLGHRTVWHVGGPVTSYPAAHRRRGWEQTLFDHRREVPPVLFGDWTAPSGYEAGRRLAADPAVTAIFAANDQMALGVLRALHEAGRAVPGEVSVVGFDDMEESAHFWPPLTTIRQSFSALGQHSVESLLEAIAAGGPQPAPISVPTQLIVRASTGHKNG